MIFFFARSNHVTLYVTLNLEPLSSDFLDSPIASVSDYRSKTLNIAEAHILKSTPLPQGHYSYSKSMKVTQ